ncbi:MAG: DUF4476 domain-containing protein [Sphingobacteriia bacterium]|nr:DUF4476 domain-containing protein [Sphingobacteriia bacterium]
MAVFSIKAQQKHFIYIQSENSQPYYVNLNNTIYSSTVTGYLNISQLVQGKYYLIVGFPRNLYPEQKFIVDVDDASPGIGFTLKQQADKSWYLVNYITNEIIGNNPEQGNKKIPAEESTGKSIMQPATESTLPSKSETENANRSSVTMPPQNNGTVIKAFEKESMQGIDMVFIDKSFSQKADTIAIFISTAQKNTSATNVTTVTSCATIAGNEDFYKLRMFMAAATTEEAMITAAEKAFMVKCFTVEQIKNLGVLFLEEENRLSFFKAAQLHLADPANFTSLENQFTKSSTIKAFQQLSKKG